MPNILFGAGRGRTLFELEQLMGEPAANSSRRYSRLAAALATTLPAAGQLELRMANMAALAPGFTPRPEYRRLLETLFQTRVEVMDFGGNPAGSVERINSFINRNTGGQIPRMLTPRQGTKKNIFYLIWFHNTYNTL
jgi:serine protease inhibitor